MQIEECREKLQDCYDNKRTVLFLDETMFTKKTYQPKEYSLKRQNILVDQANFSIKAMAFLGVISLNMGLVYYRMYDFSVNAVKFISFLRELK